MNDLFNTPVQAKHQQKKRIFTYALGALVVFSLSFGGGWLGAMSQGTDNTKTIGQQKIVLDKQSALVSTLAKQVGQSVVSVNITARQANTNPYAQLFGYDNSAQMVQAAGTGIIISEQGLVMTNRHVVPSGTTTVSLTLSDGTVLDNVKVIGRTSETDTLDIAFLKIDDAKGKTLVPASLGDSSKMQVGDSVIAIGNALGQFQNTVTTGILSGYGRSIQAAGNGSDVESLDDLFQTDAAINEGNSGGPLINVNGQVIGVNTAVASDSQNIGFAIPINNVKGLLRSVESTGKLERPFLGVRYIMLTDDIAKEFKLGVTRGAFVPTADNSQSAASVIADSPAEKGGVKPGDVITKIDGMSINEKTSLTSILSGKQPGDTVVLEVFRDGKNGTKLSVKLGSMPG